MCADFTLLFRCMLFRWSFWLIAWMVFRFHLFLHTSHITCIHRLHLNRSFCLTDNIVYEISLSMTKDTKKKQKKKKTYHK